MRDKDNDNEMLGLEALGVLTLTLNELIGKPDATVNTCYDIIKSELKTLERYRDLVGEYASMKGRKLLVSVEEIVKEFRELENEK